MEINNCLLLSIFILGIVALVGFFVTKTKGFGRFATSSFLLLLVLIISSLLFAANKIEGQVMANIFFAVIGFAGGLFTGKESNPSKEKDSTLTTPSSGTR